MVSTSSNTTAIAISGSSAGAKPVNQESVRPVSEPISAVPVLPATEWPGTAAPRAIPLSTSETIRSSRVSATSAEVAWFSSSGSKSWITDRSEERTWSTSWGFIRTPSLPRAAEIMATCMGVERTSYCPIEAMASSASVMPSGKLDGVTDMGMSRSWP